MQLMEQNASVAGIFVAEKDASLRTQRRIMTGRRSDGIAASTPQLTVRNLQIAR